MLQIRLLHHRQLSLRPYLDPNRHHRQLSLQPHPTANCNEPHLLPLIDPVQTHMIFTTSSISAARRKFLHKPFAWHAGKSYVLPCSWPFHKTFHRDKGITKLYSNLSGGSSLRVHLDNEHREEYLRHCKEKGWKNQLPSTKAAAKAVATSLAGSQDPDRRPRQPFSSASFMQHLIGFVVADDQVGCAAFSVSPFAYIIPGYQHDRMPRIPQPFTFAATRFGRKEHPPSHEAA